MSGETLKSTLLLKTLKTSVTELVNIYLKFMCFLPSTLQSRSLVLSLKSLVIDLEQK